MADKLVRIFHKEAKEGEDWSCVKQSVVECIENASMARAPIHVEVWVAESDPTRPPFPPAEAVVEL